MKAKDKILKPLVEHYHLTTRAKQRWSDAMDEYAKEIAIGFFKWYGVKMVGFIEYITKIRPMVKSDEIEEKIIEFEGKPIEDLFKLFLKENNTMTQEQKINYLRIAAGVCGFGISNQQLDLLISLYELVLEKEGKTDLHSMVDIECAVKKRADIKSKQDMLDKISDKVGSTESLTKPKYRPTKTEKNKQ